MTQEGLLGSFEQLVLLAVAHGGGSAYGMSVRREIEARSGREVTIGAVYATLERLVAKGYVEPRAADPSRVRGGRARRYYGLRPEGLAALRQARAVHDSMWEGLDPDSLLEAGGRQG